MYVLHGETERGWCAKVRKLLVTTPVWVQYCRPHVPPQRAVFWFPGKCRSTRTESTATAPSSARARFKSLPFALCWLDFCLAVATKSQPPALDGGSFFDGSLLDLIDDLEVRVLRKRVS